MKETLLPVCFDDLALIFKVTAEPNMSMLITPGILQAGAQWLTQDRGDTGLSLTSVTVAMSAWCL